MDGFQRELLHRLPLGQSVLSLFSHVLEPAFLDRLFGRFRGRGYEKVLAFSTIVYLIRDALILHEGSGRASFERAQDRRDLPTTPRAVYGKLGRMPPAVSMAFLRESSRRLQQVLPADLQPHLLRPSLAGFTAIVLDGKTIKHVVRRLKPLRNRRGRMNSGKMLAALSLNTGLVMAMNVSLSSEANDTSLVEGLLSQLQWKEGEIGLFIADRQYCDLPRLAALTNGGRHFLIRHNANIDFHSDSARPMREELDATGHRITWQWGWLGAATHSLRRYVRRITLCRPGEEDVSVVTDLLEDDQYPASDLLDAYLQRWGIERMFQQVTEVFDLKHLIGGHPKATLFQSAFCLLLYNIIQVVRSYVAGAGHTTPQEVSTEKLFVDCDAELVTWATAGQAQATVESLFPPHSARYVQQQLHAMLGGLWRSYWLKSPPQKRHGKTKRTIYPRKGYTNVWKVLEAHHNAPARIKLAM